MAMIFVPGSLINESEASAESVIKSAQCLWIFYTFGDISIFMKFLCGTLNIIEQVYNSLHNDIRLFSFIFIHVHKDCLD